jgi:hypothetical protein
LASKIFNHTFDFDAWPATSPDTTKSLKPYSESIFALREMYDDTFPEMYQEDKEREEAKKAKAQMEGNLSFKKLSSLGKAAAKMAGVAEDGKVYKIRYTLNVLPSMREDEGRLIAALAHSDELDIFNCPAVKELLQFKWERYARTQQFIGAAIHVIYILTLIGYIQTVYLTTPKAPVANHWLLAGLGTCLLYPVYNDGARVWKIGFAYFASIANYIDLLQVAFGYASIVQQANGNTGNFGAKVVMIFTVVTSLLKQFFYMRVFESFSYIVTMMQNVVRDLVVFMVFFAVLVFMFSLVFDVIAKNDAAEYHNVAPFFGNLLTTLRLALGDFDFGVLANPDRPLNIK